MTSIGKQYAPSSSLGGTVWNIIVANFDTSQPPHSHAPWMNVVCAASNLVTGLPAIYMHRHSTLSVWIAMAVLASTLYHLAEVKSRLPGLPYLRRYARLLIQVDRFFAAALMVYVVSFWMARHIRLSSMLCGVAGVACGSYSERCTGWRFVLYHSMWHLCVFTVLGTLHLR